MSSNRATATVKVNEEGRCYIPHQARRALGIHGKKARVSMEIELLAVIEDEE